MKSMTGYGYTEFQDNRHHIGLEIKSYNNRYLDIVVNMPSALGPLEKKIRDFMLSRVLRGRVEITLRFREFKEDIRVHLDKNTVHMYMEALSGLLEEAGIKEGVQLSHLLRMEGILKTEHLRDPERYWDILLPLLEKTYTDFEETRISEGDATFTDIKEQVDKIRDQVLKIKECAPELEDQIKESIKQRFQELLGNGIDENRIYSETAVLLIKYSINEELVRMNSHLSSFLDAAHGAGVIGKKLDFICQELNREINTIGSKSVMLPVSQAVIEIKDSLEKVREQLRNIE
jgi:uncharacterized protein (TIGR00255 family)